MKVREVLIKVVMVEPADPSVDFREALMKAMLLDDALPDNVVSVEIPDQDYLMRDATAAEREQMCEEEDEICETCGDLRARCTGDAGEEG